MCTIETTPAEKRPSLASEMMRSFATSTAASAGVWGGMIVAGFALQAVKKRQKAREDAETQDDQETV